MIMMPYVRRSSSLQVRGMAQFRHPTGHGPADDHELDLGGALEDGEGPGPGGSFHRSAACGSSWYQHGLSTGCPRGMTALGRPPHVAEPSPDMLGGQRGSSGSSSSWARCVM